MAISSLRGAALRSTLAKANVKEASEPLPTVDYTDLVDELGVHTAELRQSLRRNPKDNSSTNGFYVRIVFEEKGKERWLNLSCGKTVLADAKFIRLESNPEEQFNYLLDNFVLFVVENNQDGTPREKVAFGFGRQGDSQSSVLATQNYDAKDSKVVSAKSRAKAKA